MKYMVRRSKIDIDIYESDSEVEIRVDYHGTLYLSKDNKVFAAYPPGQWICAKVFDNKV